MGHERVRPPAAPIVHRSTATATPTSCGRLCGGAAPLARAAARPLPTRHASTRAVRAHHPRELFFSRTHACEGVINKPTRRRKSNRRPVSAARDTHGKKKKKKKKKSVRRAGRLKRVTPRSQPPKLLVLLFCFQVSPHLIIDCS